MQPLPQQVHLGAITAAHANTLFSVRGRVLFDFRNASGAVHQLRLQPLQLPASPDAAPVAIDLVLHGRWRAACAALRKRDLLHVDCPLVAPSVDRDIHSVRLELPDPIPDLVRAARTALYVLDDHARPQNVLSYTALAAGSGMAPAPPHLVAAFTAPVPWAPSTPPPRARAAAPVHSPGSALRTVERTSVTVGASAREYTYTPIGTLWDDEAARPSDEKLNVYGVVIDCRAPCTTRGPDLRCEVLIADESSTQRTNAALPLRTMAIYRFEKNPTNCIPFRAVGDVIRAHRVHVGRFRDPATGINQVQGIARYYSTFLMWAHESDNFLPLSSRDPVRASKRDPNPPASVTHTVTSQDRDRISALRKWARDYLFKIHKVKRPFLRTVLEVVNAPAGADFFAYSFDLVCCLEGEYTDDSGMGNIRFVVSDGLLSRLEGGKRLLVESDISADHRERAPQHPFVDFCPSWAMRPSALPAWLLIRDARVVFRGNDPVVLLSVGRKTSTVVWHPRNSPDVRSVRAQFAKTRHMPQAPRILPRPAPVCPPVVSYAPSGSLAQMHAASNPSGLGKPSVQNVPVVAVGQMQSGSASGSSLKRPLPPRRLPSHVAMGQPVRKLQAIAADDGRNRRPVSSGGAPRRLFNEARAIASRPSFPIETFVVTVHSNQNKEISTIAAMLKAVREGEVSPHRLHVNARSCISPKDVRFACRPWCSHCKKYMRMEGNNGRLDCLTCTASFRGTTDMRTQWAYMVRLNLEDESGGRIEGWIEGKEGTDFFDGVSPTNLLRSKEARQAVSNCLKKVLNPQNRLDCSVMPYEYEDENGVALVACKIFATRLLGEVVSA